MLQEYPLQAEEAELGLWFGSQRQGGLLFHSKDLVAGLRHCASSTPPTNSILWGHLMSRISGEIGRVRSEATFGLACEQRDFCCFGYSSKRAAREAFLTLAKWCFILARRLLIALTYLPPISSLLHPLTAVQLE